MWTIISGVLQIIFLMLKNKIEQDASERKRKEEISNEWVEIIKSGDKSRITALLDKLRQ